MNSFLLLASQQTASDAKEMMDGAYDIYLNLKFYNVMER